MKYTVKIASCIVLIGVLISTVISWHHHDMVYANAVKRCGTKPVIVSVVPQVVGGGYKAEYYTPTNPAYNQYAHYNPINSLILGKRIDDTACTLDAARSKYDQT